jgi:hypothetical protein
MLYLKIKNTSQPAAPSNTAPTTLTLNWRSSYPGGNVLENTPVGAVLADLSATPGTNHTFIITNDPDNKFLIVNNTVTLRVALNYATKTSHQLAIKAVNSAGETGVQNFTVNVTQVVVTQTYPVGVGSKGPKFFVLGQFIPTPSTAANVKARGCNTAYYKGDTSEFTLEQWISAMASAGLRTIRQPRGAHPINYYVSAPSTQEPDTGYDLEKSDTNLLAFVYPDEPDNVPGNVLDATTVAFNPAALQTFRNTIAGKIALPAGYNIPWLVNLVGNHVWNFGDQIPVMQDYIQGGEAEWITADVYPQVNGYPNIYRDADGMHMTYSGRCVYNQKLLAPAKVHMAVLASSDFANNGTKPTVTQYKIALWDCIIQGASGITYFSPSFTPWSWDATDPTLEAEMKVQHANIKAIEGQLLDTTNGGARSATVFTSAISGNTPGAGQLPYPFTARTIPQSDGSTFYVVLNCSESPATLTYAPWNTNAMPFAAGECKTGYSMAYTAPVVVPPPGGGGGTGISQRWTGVSRLMPGKNLIPGDPLRGDYIVGRTSSNTFKKPLVTATPAGVTFNAVNKFCTIGTGFNGQIFEDWDMSGWLLGFANNVTNVTLRQNKFTNEQNTSVSIINQDIATGLSGIIWENNDFIGVKYTRNTGPLGQLSWMNFGTAYDTIVRRNFFYYAANDVFKCDGGLIEENFIYGGGTSQGTHYDVLQTSSLAAPLTFRYNHVLAEGDNTGDGTFGGGTNILRLVPNNGVSTAGKSNPIRAYENVCTGMGWQMGVDTWDNIEIYNNWVGYWQFGPVNQSSGFLRYYNNKRIENGAPVPDINPPTVVTAPNITAVTISGSTTSGNTLTAIVTASGSAPTTTTFVWKVAGVTVGTNTGSYTTVTGDQTKTVTCTVTYANSGGSSTLTSSAFGPIVAPSGGGGGTPPSITTAFSTSNLLGTLSQTVIVRPRS